MIPVVFDLDGTLIDSLPDIAGAANLLLVDEGLETLPVADMGAFVGHGERVFMDRLIAATSLDPKDYDRLLSAFVAHYTRATGKTRLFPGARDELDRLRALGVPLGLCTNKPRGPLEAVLKAVALESSFDRISAGDDLPRKKPDPLPLLKLVEALGAETCVYVGDSEVDAETAKRAGVPFVLYTEGIRTTPVEDIPHQALFSDFMDLPKILSEFGVSPVRA